jgi:hypothetical protein
LGSDNNFSFNTRAVYCQTFDTLTEGDINEISNPYVISTISSGAYWSHGATHIDPTESTDGTFTTNDAFWSLKIERLNPGETDEKTLILNATLFYWNESTRKWKMAEYDSSDGWINPDTHESVNIIGSTLTVLSGPSTYMSLRVCIINTTQLSLNNYTGTIQ